MSEPAIRIRGLRKVYPPARHQGARTGPKEALKGIDLDIPEGRIFGLLGPNGAGKSTLINILAGLTVKTAGRVWIRGFDQDVNPRQSRAAIGVVPQELNLDAFLTPRVSLDLQAGLYGVPKRQRRTAEILREIGLADKADAHARSLSGGMRRRLLLGKALVHSPGVLVLDEPTAGVDIELRHMLWSYVRRLNAEGVTIILTTHYLEEAEEMCEEIAIINHGRIVACDRTEALVASIDAKTLVIQPERPASTPLPGLPEGVACEIRPGGALALTYSRSAHRVADLLAALSRAGITIRDVATEEPDLEDVFVALTSDTAPPDAATGT